MAKFGQYETGRPLYRTGFNAVYLWQPGEKGTRRRIIKAYQPSVRVRNERVAAAQSRAFVDSAGTQQKASREDARHWAPIHECGVSPEGAFYVTDYYDLSAQELVDGRVNVGTAGLYHLVRSVTQGLLALKRACGRPHGNLKFTNILIAKPKGLTRKQIVLTDPCPGNQLDVETHAKMDLKQLGAMIHQLVMHRNPPLVAGYQAPDSPEWQRLGRHATAWRSLCNRLLTMDVDAEPITLEQLAAQLPKIAPSRWGRVIQLVVCACLLAALVVALVTIVRIRAVRRQIAEEQLVKAAAWIKCLDGVVLNDYTHFDVLRKHDKTKWRDYKTHLSTTTRDEEVAELVQNITDCGKYYAKEGIGATTANEARGRIERLLFEPERKWLWLARLQEDVGKLRQVNCNMLADYLEAELLSRIRISDTEPPGDPNRLARAFWSAVDLAKDRWPEIDIKKVNTAAVMNDPNLCGAGPLHDSNDFLNRLIGNRDDPNDGLWAHYALDDAEGKRLDEMLGRLGRKSQGIRGGLTVAVPNDPNAANLLEKAERAISQIDAIAGKPRTRRRLREIRACESALAGIELQMRDAGEWFDIWLARAQDPNGIGSSAALKAAFLTRLGADREIGSDQAEFITKWKGQWGKLAQLGARVEATRTNLLLLDDRLPKTLAARWTSKPWAERIRAYYQNTKREELIERIAASWASTELLPHPDDYPEACRRLLDWPARAESLIADFAAIEARLNTWYGFKEAMGGPTVQDPNTIEKVYGRCRDTDLLKEPEVNGPLVPLLGRVATLETINATSDRRDRKGLLRLMTPALPSDAGAVRAIWLGLDVVEPQWPSDAGEWQQEQSIATKLESELASLSQRGAMDQERIAFLKHDFEQTREKHERTFRLAEIRADADVIRIRSAENPLLKRLVDQSLPVADTTEYIREYRDTVRSLADFITEPNWPNGYDLPAFDKEEGRRFSSEPSITPAVIRDWLETMEPDYRRIADVPAEKLAKWDARADKLRSDIDEGLKEARTTEDNQTEAALQRDKADLDTLRADFNDVRNVASIRKHQDKVVQRQDLLNVKLPDLELRVESDVRPRYCRRLRISEKGEVVFRSGLRPDVFEPVLHVPSRPGPPYTADAFVLLHARTLNEFRDRNSQLLSTYPDLLGDTGYFGTRDLDDTESPNLGWPKYIRAVTDPNVILRFVPQDSASDPPPFYMAIREITNAQFSRFLKDPKRTQNERWTLLSRSLLDIPGTCYRLGIDPNTGDVRDTSGSNPETRDFGDKKYLRLEDHPVVWVTYEGATEYAKWLLRTQNAELPKASWHKRAVLCADPQGSRYDDPTRYHIRARAYWDEVKRCKEDESRTESDLDAAGILANLEGSQHPRPEGVVHEADLPQPPPLIPTGIYPSAYPMPSDPTLLSQLALADLLGNVWEWCLDDASGRPVICGGSCLSPLTWIQADAATTAPRPAGCDLGLRVAVQCP